MDRAIELAQSGQVFSVNEIRQRLRREGHDAVHQNLHGPAINRQLIDLIRAATTGVPQSR
ncbi:hypothetical protein ACT009_05755 [Sphingomonas sp. Tas61C01]|uniref:hypothetical protein n=1 Tax=Sphingomonas sp. Tas61C01 TaxID=3458297 RepID=UPI00403EAEAC